MNRRTRVPLAAIAVLVLACGAQAQDIQTPVAPTAAPGTSGPASPEKDKDALKRLDANADGRLTKAEARDNPELARRFSELDTDNSGKLDAAEFARFEVGEPAPADAR